MINIRSPQQRKPSSVRHPIHAKLLGDGIRMLNIHLGEGGFACIAVAVLLLGIALPCHGLMAGAADGSPTDSPALRVDPNTPISPWRGVVAITVNASVYSGVLVGRRHVLTAGHVFAINGMPSSSATRIVFNLGATPTILGVDSYTMHPSFGGTGVNDLALVQLDADAPPESLVYPLAATLPALGAVLTMVGYGDSGDGRVGVTLSRSTTVKRLGRNSVDFTPDQRVYYFDFDGPPGTPNLMGGQTLGNGTETTVAGGDSGSPAFIGTASNPTLTGINAFAATVVGGPSTPSAFGTLGGGMFVAPYRAWIDATISASGFGPGTNDIPELGQLGWLGLLAVAVAITRANRAVRPDGLNSRRDESANT